MVSYAYQQGKVCTVTAYFEEGGYYQFERPMPKLKNEKDWIKFRAEVADYADKHFDDRVTPKRYAVAVKKGIRPKPAPLSKFKAPSSKKPVIKYTAKNNPLIRRR